MISEFIEKKLRSGRYKILKDKNYFGEIPGLRGVWASAKNLEDCRSELKEVLEGWLLLKLQSHDKITGLEIKIDRRELVKNA